MKVGTKDAALWRAVKQARTWLKRVRGPTVTRLFKQCARKLEEKLHRRNQREFFQHLKFMEVEETRKVHSQFIRDDEGRLLQNKKLIC